MTDQCMHVYFITDGTLYHDGDMEEIYGVVITYQPISTVNRVLQHIKKQLQKTPDVYEALAARCEQFNLHHDSYREKMTFMPYALDYSNRIGVRT